MIESINPLSPIRQPIRRYALRVALGCALITLPAFAQLKVDEDAAKALLTPSEGLVVLDVPPGKTVNIGKGYINGNYSDCYGVVVPAGATLKVTMTTESSSAYFNIQDVKDQSGAAVHRGEVEGQSATVEVKDGGTYLIRPFLERAAARQEKKAQYTLDVQITGGGTKAGGPQADTKAAQALLSSDEKLTVLEVPVGKTKKISKGVIKGHKSDAYALAVPAGTTLEVTLSTKDTSTYMNIHDVKDQSGAAVHRGDVDGATATIAVAESGTYLIRPYLYRNAARDGKTSEYDLSISVKEGSKAKGRQLAANGGPSQYDASGSCQCSKESQSTLADTCEFRVMRGQPGQSTEIWIVNVSKPDDFRILNFKNGSQQDPAKGEFTVIGDEKVTAKRVDDNWMVDVDGKEFYLIPDAVIWGG